MNKVTHIENKGPPLRPYQQEALDIMKNYTGRAGLLVLATGLGKTRIFTEFLRWDAEENDHSSLILSHREELVQQPLEYLKDLRCGVELGSKYAVPTRHTIISASVQSLVGRLKNYNPYEIDNIIIDEAHHAVAPTYRKILEWFPNARIFGFTATSHRGDGVGLGCVFHDLLFERNTLWGIQHGYLTPMVCHQAKLKYSMGSVKIMPDTGDFCAADIAKAMSGTAAGVVEAYQKYAVGPTIIFAVSVSEAQDITKILNQKYGANTAACITSSTKNRGRMLEAYKMGLVRVLVNYGVLTEGTDLPSTETVLIARPIAHTNVGLYAQMVGRGLRLYPGKTQCQIIDCVGISDYPICTAATLIGKDLPKETESQKEEGASALPPEQLPVLTGSQIPNTWIRTEKEVNIMEKSIGVEMNGVAWTELSNGGYILPVPNMVYRISRPLADGTVYLWKNKKCSKKPMPLQFIFDYVYEDLKKHHGKARHIWDKERRRYWDTEKISAAQTNLIHKLAPDYSIDTQKMTRGDASSLIQTLLYMKNDEGKAG